jgi:hypothetical protein
MIQGFDRQLVLADDSVGGQQGAASVLAIGSLHEQAAQSPSVMMPATRNAVATRQTRISSLMV